MHETCELCALFPFVTATVPRCWFHDRGRRKVFPGVRSRYPHGPPLERDSEWLLQAQASLHTPLWWHELTFTIRETPEQEVSQSIVNDGNTQCSCVIKIDG
jgi:hypothetical protein